MQAIYCHQPEPGIVDLNGKLRLHESMRVTTAEVGRERLPVLVVDNFLGDPDILVDWAAQHGAFDGVRDAFYPGVRAPIPQIYPFAVRTFLGSAIDAVFKLGNGAVRAELSHFSLVTTPPARLNVPQRMPHFDNTNPKQLAILHYLCRAECGGTSFYRHRRTGFEFVDAARRADYLRAVGEDLSAAEHLPCRYVCGSDPLFERTASFAAEFNRVVIYRSINLHSADIAVDFRFDSNPRSGRLTANTFFFYD
ncbi:MAG: DUF6445 family protein [Steroidobacteraceae bacterium]